MANGPFSVFNGRTLSLYDADGKLVGSWPAISGVRGYQEPSLQGLENFGPLPEGRYSFPIAQIQQLSPSDALWGVIRHGHDPGSVAAWGTERAFLTPDSSTDTMGRKGFSIHGGFWPGSEGCIDVGPNEQAFFAAARRLGSNTIPVIVSYDKSLETQAHPLARQTFFDGASDDLGRGAGIALDGLKDIGNYISDSIVTPAYGGNGTNPAIPDRTASVLPGNGILSGASLGPPGGTQDNRSGQSATAPGRDPWVMPGNGVLSGVRLVPGNTPNDLDDPTRSVS